MNKEQVIYSIVVEDVYTVAQDVLERKPSKDEIQFIEKKIGDHIQWHDIIENLLHDYNVSKKAYR